jgi:lysylphosphatidylglycerol synthetase-like protein (DUF2156 family)
MAGSETPASGPNVVKARKAPRMTYKQEIQTIQNLPRIQRFIVVMKIAGVFLVAIGIEGIVTATWWMALLFIPVGVVVSMMPIKIRTDRCIACRTLLGPGTAICPACGAPQM